MLREFRRHPLTWTIRSMRINSIIWSLLPTIKRKVFAGGGYCPCLALRFFC